MQKQQSRGVNNLRRKRKRRNDVGSSSSEMKKMGLPQKMFSLSTPIRNTTLSSITRTTILGSPVLAQFSDHIDEERWEAKQSLSPMFPYIKFLTFTFQFLEKSPQFADRIFSRPKCILSSFVFGMKLLDVVNLVNV